LPDLEHWVSWERANGLPAFHQASNMAIISGPSRTSDIAMESILWMHGPGELHVVILFGGAK
jgi:L-lactate utilization protein LutC